MNDNDIVEVTEEHARAHIKDKYADTPLMETLVHRSSYVLKPEAAKVLASTKDSLELNGLVSLPSTIAEILSDSETHHLGLANLKELDAEAAIHIAKFKASLDLSGLERISDEAAAAFASYQDSLDLSSLKELSEVSAQSLATSGNPVSWESHSCYLNLSGLEELGEGVAKALATKKFGNLDLSGVRFLSDADAEALATATGFPGTLCLGGLQNSYTYWLASDGSKWKKKKEATDAGYVAKQVKKVTKELSETALVSLANHKGSIELDGLKNLTTEAAKAFGMRPIRYGFVRFRKKLKLSEIEASWLWHLDESKKTNIGDTICEQSGADLDLDGLQELEEVGDDSLAKHPQLFAREINELSKEGAQIISKHVGEVRITCPTEDPAEGEWWRRKVGAFTIDDTVAEILSSHKGHIELRDLETITPTQALSFSKHKWHLGLLGLKSIDENLAKALAEHQGRLQVNGDACSEEAKSIFENNEHVIAY